jgi:hypothetical protein
MPTQSFDIFNPSGAGIDFASASLTWTISPGVVVASAAADGVSSTHKNDTLLNFGQIFSGFNSTSSGTGVSFTSDDGTLVNQIGASIFAVNIGVDVNRGNTETIENFGSISSLGTGVSFHPNSNFGSMLTNRGSIYGHDVGVLSNSSNVGATINNFGIILSDQGNQGFGPSAIVVATSPGLTTTVTNAAKGLIEGADGASAVITFDGAISLTNLGTIIGNVWTTLTGMSDVIINHGKIEGEVELGGNDLFNGAHGTSGAIFANGGTDRIIAGKGNVQIHLVGGSDLITAGQSHDKFMFESAPGNESATITNFNPSRDRIVLSASDFAGIGPVGHVLAAADFHIGTHATTPSQHIIYDAKNGFLFYDPDGKGPQAEIHFATLGNHPTLTHATFLVEA